MSEAKHLTYRRPKGTSIRSTQEIDTGIHGCGPKVDWVCDRRPDLLVARLNSGESKRPTKIDVAKENFGVRPAVVLDPIDRLAYQALDQRPSSVFRREAQKKRGTRRRFSALALLLLAACAQGPSLPPVDDPRIPAVVVWLEDRGAFCAEDHPNCLPDAARQFIAENEAEGIYTLPEMFERSESLSDP